MKHIFLHTPNGICQECHLKLLELMNNKPKQRQLRITTGIELGQVNELEGKCSCHICWLGNLWGPELHHARKGFKSKVLGEVEVGGQMRRCNQCFEPTFSGSSSNHVCVGKRAVIENLKIAIPKETRMKLAIETLKEVQGETAGDTIELKSVRGGRPTSITIGRQTPSSSSNQVTLGEMQKIGSDAHLTGGQLRNVMANFRAKFGRSFAESGLDQQLVMHNGRFLPFFTCERNLFEKGGEMIEKPLFFCHSSLEFLKEVARLRGKEWGELTLLVQGDSGQGWFKLAVSLIPLVDLEERERAGGRRLRVHGIASGTKFKSYGVRQILILALVQGVPENSFNLALIFRLLITFPSSNSVPSIPLFNPKLTTTSFRAVQLSSLQFRITGDLHFLMPIFGLLGCGSSNPCLFCEAERRRIGGLATWEPQEQVQLRSFGRLEMNYEGWMHEGGQDCVI